MATQRVITIHLPSGWLHDLRIVCLSRPAARSTDNFLDTSGKMVPRNRCWHKQRRLFQPVR